MPSIHVLYDPHDRISHQADMIRALGAKVAIMPLGDTDLANIGATAETLTCLLLDQIEKSKADE